MSRDGAPSSASAAAARGSAGAPKIVPTTHRGGSPNNNR